MDAAGLTESAREKRKSGDGAGARRELDEALRLDPTFAEAWLLRGVVRMDAEDLDGAMADLDESIRLRPEEARAHFNRGYALELSGRDGEALAAYERATKLDPSYARARSAFDEMRIRPVRASVERKSKAGDAEGAARELDEAVQAMPDSPALRQLRGLARLQRDDPSGALADFEEAARLDPQNARAQFNRGIALNNLGRIEEAVPAYERALEIDPSYERPRKELDERARALYDRANGKLQSDPAGADRDLDEAIRLCPRWTAARIQRGVARINRRDDAGALADLDEALKLDPDDARAHCNRGIALLNLGRAEEAAAEHRRALEIDPSYERPRQELAALQKRPEPKPAPAAAPARAGIDWGSWGCGLVLLAIAAVVLYFSALRAADVYFKAGWIAAHFPPDKDLCFEPFCLNTDTGLAEDTSGTFVRFHGCPEHRQGAALKLSGRVRASAVVLGILIGLLYVLATLAVTALVIPIAGALFRIALWPALIPMRLAGRVPPRRILPFHYLKEEGPTTGRWYDGPEVIGMVVGLLVMIAAWGLYLWW